MKNIFTKLLFITAFTVVFFSCKKEETRAVLSNNGAPTLSISSTNFALLQANANSHAGTFHWTEADLGYEAAVDYTLQISKSGTNWASASTIELGLGSKLFRNFTVTELNRELLKYFPAGVTTFLDVRVKGVVGPSVPPIYSNIVTIRATPYRDVIIYEFPQAIRIAGNYQGWDPGSAPKIVDKNASGTTGSNYEGYINFTNASPEFKMVKGNNWGAGDFGSGGGNALTNGGNNLTLSQGAGVYKINANTVAMTWSSMKINTWGIIGSFNGWSGSVPMTMNPDGTYTVTQAFTAGDEFKFRANNDWGLNYGDNKSGGGPDNAPDQNGDNIAIAVSGNYQVILDFTVAGNYSYTLRKL